MKDRWFQLGDMKVKYSDLGLDFYSSRNNHLGWLNQASVDELVRVVNKNDFEYERYVLKNERLKKLNQLKKIKIII